MIEETKALLHERNVTRAVVIDDAFDAEPRRGDIDDGTWDRFFDDITEEDEAGLKEAYGSAAYDDQTASQLRRDSRFISVAWVFREKAAAARELFADFEHTQERKRSDLAPLLTLLGELGLDYTVSGRDGTPKLADAQLVFLDLFLGREDDQNAVSLAIERVKQVISKQLLAPPSVVLMSASPRLAELAPRVRDEGELLGCLFRTVRKASLGDSATIAEQIYNLVVANQDAAKLNAYVLAWDDALTEARKKFLRTIRTLDLPDYSNLQALTLEAEREKIGDYVIDLYDLHLHSVVEGEEALVRAAKALNSIAGETQAPGQFMPPDQVVSMMDAAMFYNEVRTRIEGENMTPVPVNLGDVFMAPALDTGSAEALGAGVTRYVYVVLSQACDLRHGGGDRILLLRGGARPYSWKHHVKSKVTRTPVMTVGNERFVIDWDPLAPETWLLTDLERKVAAEGYRCVRRFRAPFALALQQSFIGQLGRVGTLAALPARFDAGVKLFVRSKAGDFSLLVDAPRDTARAVCLVGRRSSGDLKEWLLLDEGFLAELRTKLQDLGQQKLRAEILAVSNDPRFFRRLKQGLEFKRGQDGARPFKGGPFDLVQIYTAPKIGISDGALPSKPFVFEIDAE